MPNIPYEAQLNRDGQRTCGAAALTMIYQSMGINIPQLSIWRVISLPDAHGGRFARTYRLAFDPLLRGLNAIAIKAIDPIRAVKQILASGCSVIMNHRLKEDTSTGHYTVALSADDNFIAFHDPQFGPAQKRSLDEMRLLWTPKYQSCEITGNFLIAIARSPTANKCNNCSTMIPKSKTCPTCLASFPLQPAVALGCIDEHCPARLWQLIVCPYCDTTCS